MTTNNPVIEYDEKNESIRTVLMNFISDRGIKQTFIANKCSISNTSLSMFLNKKRMLTDIDLEMIMVFIKSKTLK